MTNKKIALDILVNISNEDISVEELNKELAKARDLLEEVGDAAGDEFKALKTVIETADGSMENAVETLEKVNAQTKDFKENLDDTGKAGKKAESGTKALSSGIKGIGLAIKALGIGLIIGAFKLLQEAFSRNQKVADFFAAAMDTVSIVLNQVVDVVTTVIEKVAASSKGFEGLRTTISGLITLAITPLKLNFFAIKLVLQEAQLAWESSFFGNKDPQEIKALNEKIKGTTAAIVETKNEAIKAGADVVNNFGKAINEVGDLVTGTIEGISEISVKGSFATAKANKELENSAKIAAAEQAKLLEIYDRQAEIQRQLRDDTSKSISDRKKANEELGRVLENQIAAMIKVADLQIASAAAELRTNKTIENRVALKEAEANKLGILAQVEGLRSEQQANKIAIDKEEIDLINAKGQSEADLAYERKIFDAQLIDDKLEQLEALKAIEADREQTEKARLQSIIDATNEGTQARVDAQIAYDEFEEASRQKTIDLNLQILDETMAIWEREDAIELKRFEDKKAREKELQDFRIKTTYDMFNALSALATAFAKGDEESQKKAFKINKALNIGVAIMQTAQAVTGALTAGGNPIKLATGAQFVEAGIAAAVGAAQIATIAKTQFGGGATGINTNVPDSPVGQTFQPRAFTSPTNDLPQQSIKVHVVETDITNSIKGVEGIYNRAVVVE